jgi:hypothetical protein
LRARPPILVACVVLAAGAACQSSPPPAPAPLPLHERSSAFDPARAWAHLSALAAIGPRVAGTEGSAQARAYIRGELEKLGLEVREQHATIRRGDSGPTLEIVNLAAKIPGSSSEDLILLMAPYDSERFETFRFLGVNDGASGAALLLEDARVLAADPLPYTTWVVFLDGEAPLAPGAAPASLGSRALAKRLTDSRALPSIRLALAVNRVCDADLTVTRDLMSNRAYREEFWHAAARLGYTQAFPQKAPFESASGSHRALADQGFGRVVALADTSFGGSDPPGIYAGTADDDLAHCSQQSLETVGRVSLEGLESVSERLAKIDRFAAAPVATAVELDAITGDSPAPSAEAPATPPAPAPSGAAPTPAPPETAAPGPAGGGETPGGPTRSE